MQATDSAMKLPGLAGAWRLFSAARTLFALVGLTVVLAVGLPASRDFLLRQLELREELEAAMQKKDSALLDALRATIAGEKILLENQIAEGIDKRKDFAGSAGPVRKLMFLDRLIEEIDSAYEEIE